MIWHYICPVCNELRSCNWEERSNPKICHKKGITYQVPSPSDQNDAFVDTHNWPVEMEDVVYAVKGNKCTNPNCNKNAETLDHRVAFTKGGKTSVENLFPMCEECNLSKGDKNYTLWLSGY